LPPSTSSWRYCPSPTKTSPAILTMPIRPSPTSE